MAIFGVLIDDIMLRTNKMNAFALTSLLARSRIVVQIFFYLLTFSLLLKYRCVRMRISRLIPVYLSLLIYMLFIYCCIGVM